jgi:hypothetical protein
LRPRQDDSADYRDAPLGEITASRLIVAFGLVFIAIMGGIVVKELRLFDRATGGYANTSAGAAAAAANFTTAYYADSVNVDSETHLIKANTAPGSAGPLIIGYQPDAKVAYAAIAHGYALTVSSTVLGCNDPASVNQPTVTVYVQSRWVLSASQGPGDLSPSTQTRVAQVILRWLPGGWYVSGFGYYVSGHSGYSAMPTSFGGCGNY